MLAKYKLSLIFLLGLITTIFIPPFFPFCRFIFFAPFLIVCLYQKSLLTTLWLASLVGMIDDLLSTTIFGLSSCNYVLVSTLLFRLKRYFFEDHLTTLFIMTFFFSSLSMMVKFLFTFALGPSFPFSWHFIFTDFLAMSLFEGLFAFSLYIIPYKLYKFFKNYLKRLKTNLKSH